MRCSGSARAVSMQIGMSRSRFDLARKLEAADAGHHDVEQHDVEVEAPERGLRHRGIGGRRDAEALGEEIAREQVADLVVVIDDQHVRRIVGQGLRALTG